MRNHGLSKTRFYCIWRGIKLRCYNEKRKDYELYGKLGIEVSKEWHEFMNFKNDMYESYLKHVEQFGEKDTTLDRLNSDGHYEPNNCRWATQAEQLKNRRKYSGRIWFIAIDPNGIEYRSNHQKEFSVEHKLKLSSVHNCLRGNQKQYKGWTFKYLEE